MSNLTDVQELLGREAELAATTVGVGLTELRKYDFATIGRFYSGIFSYTIGIERICKLVLLLDYLFEKYWP